MALYLGNSKRKFILNNAKKKVVVPEITTADINNKKLLSLDDYVLLDSNGLYLIAKEGK